MQTKSDFPPPVKVDHPRIQRKVVLLNHHRRKLHLDKDLIASSVEDLSKRYDRGSLFQDLQTGVRKVFNASIFCTGCWSFAEEQK